MLDNSVYGWMAGRILGEILAMIAVECRMTKTVADLTDSIAQFLKQYRQDVECQLPYWVENKVVHD